MAYDYVELKDANGAAFKAASKQVEASPNVVNASIIVLDAERTEDVAHVSSDTGLMLLAVRKAAAKTVRFRTKSTGVIWEMEEGSEAANRCRRLKLDYEEVKPEKGA